MSEPTENPFSEYSENTQEQRNTAITFFRSYHDCVSHLDVNTQNQFFGALVRYAFVGKYPDDLPQHLHSLFIVVKPNIDASVKKREDGKRGGRPRKKNQ